MVKTLLGILNPALAINALRDRHNMVVSDLRVVMDGIVAC